MKMRIIHIIFFVSMIPVIASAQDYNSDFYKVIKGSTVELDVGAYRGTLQWQYSTNTTVWLDITGQNNSSLNYTVEFPVFLRLGVKDGECDWLYSDIVNYIPISPPIIITNDAVNISSDSVQYSGEVISNGNGTISRKGICYGLTDPPTLDDSVIENGNNENFFWGTIGNLSANTTYFLRAFAENEAGLGYGNTISFITVAGLPIVITDNADAIEQTSAVLHGLITSAGGSTIDAKGFCWSLLPNPDLNDNYTDLGAGSSAFSSTISGLNPGTKYYYRAFALNEAGLAFGINKEFITSVYLPQLSSCSVSNIGATRAQISANISYDGSGTINSFGICWSTNNEPTITDFSSSGNSETGQFNQEISNLSRNTQYYVRAYASNQAGLAYGEITAFTTLEDIPLVTTGTASERTDISVRISGSAVVTGNSDLIETGICWSDQPNPDINSNCIPNSTPINEFNIRITNLQASTTYYFKAYAKNQYATGYGDELQLSTKTEDYYTTESTLTTSSRSSFKGWSGIYPDYGSSGNGFSGVTYNWDNDQLYIIGNNAKAIWVIHAPGSDQWSDSSPGNAYIKTIPLSGYEDPEGICYLGNGWVMIADESLREVSFTKITAQTTSINKSSGSVVIDPTSLFSTNVSASRFRRLEGIAYDFHNKIIYGLCETGTNDHPRLFAWDWDFENQKINPSSQREVTSFFPGLRDNWDEGSDLHYSPLLKRLYVVSGEDDVMAEYNCPHPDESGYGNLISTRQLPRSNGSSGNNLGDCEGICISKDGTKLFLCYENESFGYAPLPFVRYLPNDNLPSNLFPFQ